MQDVWEAHSEQAGVIPLQSRAEISQEAGHYSLLCLMWQSTGGNDG